MDKFPGHLAENGFIWQFPSLTVEKIKGGVNITTIYVGVLNSKVDIDLVSSNMNPMYKGKPNPNYDPNFRFSNFTEKIQDDYFYNGHIAGKIGFFVTEHHQEGSTVSYGVITFVEKGTNLTKSNRTNVFTQALKAAQSHYNKKLKEQTHKETGVIRPMLAEGESLSADENSIKNYIEDEILPRSLNGVFCQPKLDGVRCLCTLNPKHYPNNKVTIDFETDEQVVCYSREGKKVFVALHLLDELHEILITLMAKSNASFLILDGEYYRHNMEFNIISGCARGNDYTSIKSRIGIQIYDYYDGTNASYTVREAFLMENSSLFDYKNSPLSILDDSLSSDGSEEREIGHVELLETRKLFNLNEIYEYYEALLARSYEGMMIRIPNGIYAPNKRSKDLIKIKPIISREYVCVGYEFGKGKDSDVPTIICKIGKKGIVWGNDWRRAKDENVSVSNISPNTTFRTKFKGMSLSDQRKLGESFGEICPNGQTRFENYYKGKKITVEFYSYSIDCKPEKSNCRGDFH